MLYVYFIVSIVSHICLAYVKNTKESGKEIKPLSAFLQGRKNKMAF